MRQINFGKETQGNVLMFVETRQSGVAWCAPLCSGFGLVKFGRVVTVRSGLKLPTSVLRRNDPGPFDKAGEAREAAPYDGRPRWWV